MIFLPLDQIRTMMDVTEQSLRDEDYRLQIFKDINHDISALMKFLESMTNDPDNIQKHWNIYRSERGNALYKDYYQKILAGDYHYPRPNDNYKLDCVGVVDSTGKISFKDKLAFTTLNPLPVN